MKTLFVSAVSACFELENDAPFYAPEPFRVTVDDRELPEQNSNVFSVFGLKPDTKYTVLAEGAHFSDRAEFTTPKERCAVDVTAFGAKGDGVTENTAAIQAAVNYLPEGGRLYFPAGTYLTLPVALKSHMTVEFAEGAVLLGSTERKRYPVIPGVTPDLGGGEEVFFGTFEGNTMTMYQSLLSAAYAEDITIIGPGTVDGNAQNSDFWTAFKEDPIARPRLLFFNRCKNITVHGIKACNSASWQLHPFFTDHISFFDVSVSAPKISPNTDALDPESCDDVQIIGCRFTVGDDCIAIKSGKIELGQRFNKSADHHTIRNCLMAFGHGAVTLGSEIGAGVKNLSVSQCWFQGTDRGLRIKTRRGRGKNCRIEHVEFSNIRMENVLTPFVINMYYNCCDPDKDSEYVWSREMLPVDDRTPHLGSFHFRDIECTGTQVAVCSIEGLPEMPVEEVEFKNVSVRFADDAKPGVPAMKAFSEPVAYGGLELGYVKKVRIENVSLEGVRGEKLKTKFCGEVVTEGFEA